MKTNELTDIALDWAVAECLNLNVGFDSWGVYYIGVVQRNDDGLGRPAPFNPSTNWSQGGPIIEREMIATSRGGSYSENFWMASVGFSDNRIYGTTPLIAAMRCYVASKLGNDIEVPKGLI